MLKIWLTWLQPSLGLLGTALVLSEPFCAYAATKPSAARSTVKVPTQISQWSSARSTGTRIDKELLSGIAPTPDLAVRQLAIDAMGTSGIPATNTLAKANQSKRATAFDRFVSPSAKLPKSAARVSKLAKPHRVNNSVAAALARAINPEVTVPGLYIGKTDVRVAKRFLPTAKPVAQPISTATEIGAPTPLSAMMANKAAIDPFPVVRPELMQKLQQAPVTASVPATKTKKLPVVAHSLDPIATLQSGKPHAAVFKTIVPKNPTVTHSLDPIAAIPTGLQRLLGNNLKPQSIVASASVAKPITIKPRAVLALKQLVSPTATAHSSVSASSLQLATAQAYISSVPKFDIPGERVLTPKPMKSSMSLLVVKRAHQNLTTSVVTRKSNYISILTPAPKQSWTVINQRNNLGGLILGSQPPVVVRHTVRLAPVDTFKTAASTGLPASFN